MKKSKLESLAVLVAGGSTIRAAAAETGCSESHAYHLSADDAFRLRVAQIRTEATMAAVGRLADAAAQAVDTLRELLDATNDPSVRLNAAKAILNALGPITEQVELRQRLDAIESQNTLRIAK